MGALTTALVLAACPPPGGGGGSTTYTTTVTGTVTGSAAGESASIDLPGATVSALTTPADPVNRPVTSGPDGRFTLQVKHAGSFKLKVGNTCSDPFTGAAVTASADGTHNAGTLQLTLKPEPAGTARYSITPRTAGGFKLTVNNCVREIGNNEFNGNGTIITAKATAEGKNRFNMITEIDLPPTLTKIGERAFALHLAVSRTLTIPRNVAVIDSRAFQSLGSGGASITVDIRSDKLAKPEPAPLLFPLRNTLFQDVSGITSIKLPAEVYDSYTKAQLQAIFGGTFTNYRRPDGTSYDFAAKS